MTQPTEPGHAGALRVIFAAMIANGFIAVAKFVAFGFTASSAMLAEAFHSVADTGNQLLMMLGVKRELKPPDHRHPYGYGKEGYFWSFVVALSLFSLGAAFALYEGIHKLQELRAGHTETGSQVVGMIVLGVSLAVEGWSFMVAIKEFNAGRGNLTFREAIQEARSAEIITVLFEDTAAVIGLAVALLGAVMTQLTGNGMWDAAATLVIALVLASVSVFLATMTKRLLIGQSASRRVEAQIAQQIRTVEGVEDIVELRTLHMGGSFILLNLGVKFRGTMTVTDLERTIDAIETRVKAAVPDVKRIFIEADTVKAAGQPRGQDGPVP